MALPAPPQEPETQSSADRAHRAKPATESAIRRHIDNLVGSTIADGYRVIRTLHRGNVGVVFEAEQLRLQRRVAIKLLPWPYSVERRARARFEREVAILSQLRHPHVVEVLDYDVLPDDSPFLVMELLRGETLSKRLAKQKRLPLNEVLRIVKEVASALNAVHDAAIVHRDLKPGNVFLMRVPHRGMFVKLLDFGISQVLGGQLTDGRERELLGTPQYMSPEQVLLDDVDPRTDEYALAVMTWEALSGARPFQKRSMMSLLHEIVISPPSWMDFAPLGIPSGVEGVLRRALSKDPIERYPSVTAFADALETAATQAPEATTTTDAERIVSSELERAHAAFQVGLFELAASHVETALSTVEQSDDQAARAQAIAARDLIDRIFSACLGNVGARVRVVRHPSANDELSISPEEAYLMSRVDGELSVEDLLDISPMPSREVARLIIALLRKRLIRIV